MAGRTTNSARSSLEPLEDLELPGGQRVLACALVSMRQPVMRLREVGLQSYGSAQFLNRFVVPQLVREQDPELEETLGQPRVQRDRSSEQCFNLFHVGWLRFRWCALPEAERVLEVGQRIPRLCFDEARETFGDLAPELRGDAIHLAQKLVRARIRRREVHGSAKRLHGILVLPSRILGDAQSDVESRRLRVA